MAGPALPERKDWRRAVAPFESPSLSRSLIQIADTLIPYFLLVAAMIFSLRVSYWLTLGLAVPAAGFLIRAFIIFHDCGHGAFFRSRRANRIVEFITGLLNFMPAQVWSRDHARHHASAGDLDHRGTGDIWTMTLEEYRRRSAWGRIRYRVYRHPLSLFVVGPLYIFLVEHRFWRRGANARRRWNIVATNAALVAIMVAAGLTIGLKAYVMVQLPILMIAGAAGIWLFYVQHQFEDTYWERHDGWDYVREAMAGSSFYKLPRILQWFSGNIGYHHIHHLSPRIPNYFLQRCHEASPIFRAVPPLTVRASLRALRLHLWDEERRKLVGFGAA